MIFADVDPVLRPWIDQHGLQLFTEWADAEARFCYITGGRQECFQVSIDASDPAKLVVAAHSIETIDDTKLAKSWTTSRMGLAVTLEAAWKQIEAWKSRTKGPTTWTPSQSWGEPR